MAIFIFKYQYLTSVHILIKTQSTISPCCWYCRKHWVNKWVPQEPFLSTNRIYCWLVQWTISLFPSTSNAVLQFCGNPVRVFNARVRWDITHITKVYKTIWLIIYSFCINCIAFIVSFLLFNRIKTRNTVYRSKSFIFYSKSNRFTARLQRLSFWILLYLLIWMIFLSR